MYAFYVSGNNITEKVERKSLRIQEQLNNRRNTASFRLLDDFQVQEGQEIEIYKQAKIKSRAGNIIFLQSESEWQIKNRFFIGQKIHIRGSETEHISNITNLDYNQGSITLQSIPASLDISGKEAAIKIFG